MTDRDAYVDTAARKLINPDGERLALVLHGLGGDRHQALGLVDGLRDPRLAILAPDLRAHGDTQLVGGPEAFTFDALVEDILALVEHLGQASKPTYVAGISMGAALALRLALSRRLDIRGAALVRPAFGDTPNPENLAVLPITAELLRSADPETARTMLLATPEYQAIAAVTASGAANAAEQLAKPQARDRAIRLAEVPKNVAWSESAELQGLDVPVLVVGVDLDVIHPLSLAQRTAALLPGSRLVEAPPRDVDPVVYDREIRTAVQSHIAAVMG